jgi:hypothetical protein
MPLLKPSLQVALILRTILAFQVFAVVVAISGGDVVTTLANETYREVDGILYRPDLQKYLGQLAISTTYTKAASYLMHEGNFHWIRSFILEHSPSYLQDDSGIPLQYFDETKWRLKLYGHYDVPIQLFLKYTQPELARRYADRKKVRALPFGIGYKVWPGRSNLQLAIRK